MIIEAEYEDIEEADGELDLSGDESLPWLEADEEDEGGSAIDVRQVVIFFLVLILILAAIVWAIWHFSNRSGDADLVADGSTIEAPDGPILSLIHI